MGVWTSTFYIKESDDMKKKILSRYEAEKIVEKALDIGEEMIKCGAEITRVEDTMKRICCAYTDGIVDVFSVVSLMIISLHTTDEENITQTRRIYSSTNNLNTLEQLNELSRYICSTRPCIEEIEDKINRILEPKKNTNKKTILGYALATFSFAIFFGGNVRDGIAAAIVSFLFFLFDNRFYKKVLNKVVYTFLCAFVIGCLATISVWIRLGQHVDMIIIGNIMLLIPGISFMNSVKDMLCGDTMSGMLRLIESILIAIAIAVGFALALMIWHIRV